MSIEIIRMKHVNFENKYKNYSNFLLSLSSSTETRCNT